jgi:hypothetical protein
MRLVVFVAVALTVGCSAAPARIADPVAFESFCGTQTIEPQVLKSVLAATGDSSLSERPNEVAVRAALRNHRGVIAYWNDQQIALPQIAASLGERDGYVRLRALAVTVVPANAMSRRIYMLVRDHSLARWIVARSSDAGSICTAPKS